MDTIEKMHDAIRAAEEATDADTCKAHLLTARTVLADATVAGETLDHERLVEIVLRAGVTGHRLLQAKDHRGIKWGSLVVAVADYLEHGQVHMPDGSVATKHGWSGAPKEKKLPDFETMTQKEAVAYLHRHRDEFIRGFDDISDGIEQFDCLVVLIETGSPPMSPTRLPEHGFEFPEQRPAAVP